MPVGPAIHSHGLPPCFPVRALCPAAHPAVTSLAQRPPWLDGWPVRGPEWFPPTTVCCTRGTTPALNQNFTHALAFFPVSSNRCVEGCWHMHPALRQAHARALFFGVQLCARSSFPSILHQPVLSAGSRQPAMHAVHATCVCTTTLGAGGGLELAHDDGLQEPCMQPQLVVQGTRRTARPKIRHHKLVRTIADSEIGGSRRSRNVITLFPSHAEALYLPSP